MSQPTEYDALGWPARERSRQDRHAESGSNQSEDCQDVTGFVCDGGCEARLRAGSEDEVVECGPHFRRYAHERVRTEVDEPNPPRACQGVSGWQRGDQGLDPYRLGGDVPVRHGKDREGDVDSTVCERFDLFSGVEGLEVESHARMARQEGVQDLSPHAGLGSDAESDRKAADFPASCPASRRHGVVGVLENAPRLLQEGATGLREGDEMPRSVEEIDTELPLQILNLVRQRRLRDVELFCGTAEVKLVGDRNEVTQMPQFHAYPPFDRTFVLKTI